MFYLYLQVLMIISYGTRQTVQLVSLNTVSVIECPLSGTNIAEPDFF